MTEKAFWAFINMAIAIKGRLDHLSSYTDSQDKRIREESRYLSGHSILFNGHNRIPEEQIKEIGNLLFDLYV